jgi:hypothetical protein
MNNVITNKVPIDSEARNPKEHSYRAAAPRGTASLCYAQVREAARHLNDTRRFVAYQREFSERSRSRSQRSFYNWRLPHLRQNFELVGFVVPQALQPWLHARAALGAKHGGRQIVAVAVAFSANHRSSRSSSSNTLASLRSAVSKPSVNQP